MDLNWLHFLYDTSSSLPQDEGFYTKLLRDDDFRSNAPQVYHLLKEQQRLELTPLFFQHQAKDLFKKSYFQNLFIKNQAVQILKLFEEQEIDVIPLKGVFFSEKYFGHLGARTTSDIDLLIKHQDLQIAMVLINTLGFTVEEEEIAGHFHRSFSKELPGSVIPLTVELHWDLLQDRTASFDIMDFWQQSRKVEPYSCVRELTSYHTFYMICLHGWRHNLDSVKYFLDIIQLISRVGDEIEYSILIKDAFRHKTYRRMTRTLSILYQECPFLENLKPCPYKDKKIYLSYEEKKGQSQKVFSKYKDFIEYQFFSYDTAWHRIRQLRNWLK